jgi:hypothetical protein
MDKALTSRPHRSPAELGRWAIPLLLPLLSSYAADRSAQSPPQDSPASPAPQILATFGGNFEYSSVDGAVSRQMCPTERPVIGAGIFEPRSAIEAWRAVGGSMRFESVQAKLSGEELERIATIALDSGFFTSEPFVTVPTAPPKIVIRDDGEELEEVQIVTAHPCFSASISIDYRGQSNTRSWSCLTATSDRPEISALQNALAPYIAKLPKTNCVYGYFSR